MGWGGMEKTLGSVGIHRNVFRAWKCSTYFADSHTYIPLPPNRSVLPHSILCLCGWTSAWLNIKIKRVTVAPLQWLTSEGEGLAREMLNLHQSELIYKNPVLQHNTFLSCCSKCHTGGQCKYPAVKMVFSSYLNPVNPIMHPQRLRTKRFSSPA